MKTTIILTLVFSFLAFAEAPRKDLPKKDQMDEADQQLLRRDACRKPIEALETKYDQVDKKDLEKLKSNCQY